MYLCLRHTDKVNMNSELLWLILTMGIGVLFTYVHLFNSSDISTLTKGISNRIFCGALMVVTIIAFVYISIHWIWFLPPDLNAFGAVVLYFLGALLRAPLTAEAIHRDEKTSAVGLSMSLVGIGSIGFVIVSLQHKPLLIIASVWLMFHHVILDGLWYVRWHFLYSANALFTLESTENFDDNDQRTNSEATTNYSQYNDDLQSI